MPTTLTDDVIILICGNNKQVEELLLRCKMFHVYFIFSVYKKLILWLKIYHFCHLKSCKKYILHSAIKRKMSLIMLEVLFSIQDRTVMGVFE